MSRARGKGCSDPQRPRLETKMRQYAVGELPRMCTLFLVCNTFDVESITVGGIEVSTSARDSLDGLHAGKSGAHKCEGGRDAQTHS